jgi:antitoxin HicB
VSDMRSYTVVLTPDLEDGGYIVTVPTLPGCFTEGDTIEEALENARDVIETFVAALRDLGEPVPVEREMPKLAQVQVAV